MSHLNRAKAPPQTGATRWHAEDYHHHASVQTGWGRDVHARLDLRGDEQVVDLGCGDGRLTAELATRVPRGSLMGLDADPEMVDFATRRYAGAGVTFVHGDVRDFSLGRQVEVFVSTATLHWVGDFAAVLRCCRAHLAPGGRLFFQMGGRGNCAELLAAARATARQRRWACYLEPFTCPWIFRGPEECEALLPRCGFAASRVELVEKDMVHGGPEELRAWMRTTWMPILARVPESCRGDLVEAIVARHLGRRPVDADGRTHAAMVRLEVEAVAV